MCPPSAPPFLRPRWWCSKPSTPGPRCSMAPLWELAQVVLAGGSGDHPRLEVCIPHKTVGGVCWRESLCSGLPLLAPVLTASGRSQQRGEGKESPSPKGGGGQVCCSARIEGWPGGKVWQQLVHQAPRHPLDRLVSAYRMIFQDWYG